MQTITMAFGVFQSIPALDGDPLKVCPPQAEAQTAKSFLLLFSKEKFFLNLQLLRTRAEQVERTGL